MHIHQGEDISGKRREALRMLKKANNGIIWAIGQSKDPRVKNNPGSYLTKLRDAFESNFAKFKKSDLFLLEPIINKIIYSIQLNPGILGCVKEWMRCD